jgi:uncharacterized membrane protein
MLKKFPKKDRKWLHILLLLGWLVIAVGLRFAHLEEKSLSSIEVSTLGFSLGHGFQEVPLDRVISLDTLLSPLQSFPITSSREVVDRLMSESNHPPLYFLLTHWWLNFLGIKGESALVWEGRSLSAIFGAASIPAMFGLGWLAFRSLLVGQIAAALMAVSPYGIYLAQEARHYTLTIFWIIASLSCLLVAIRSIERRIHLPISIVLVWIVVNSLGIVTHYFFALALCAEGCVISAFWLRDFYSNKSFPSGYWWRIYAVIAGTAIGCLVWFPVVASASDHNELTDWIATDFDLDEIWQPIPRLLGWWITMVFLLPVEGTNLPVTLLSGLVLLTVLLWVFPALIRGWRIQMASLSSRLSMQVLGGFLVGAIAIFLIVIYGSGKDLSLAARYHFVYFPALIVLLGAALAICWQESNGRNWQARGKKVVVAILVMGLLGGLTVISNYGYQKSQRADLLADYIQARSQMPVSIAMTYETHAELRKLISLGMEFERSQDKGIQPQFLLVRQKKDSSPTLPSSLATALEQISQPLDLWAVDLKIDSRELEALNCDREQASHPDISGYKYQLYHCRQKTIT